MNNLNNTGPDLIEIELWLKEVWSVSGMNGLQHKF